MPLPAISARTLRSLSFMRRADPYSPAISGMLTAVAFRKLVRDQRQDRDPGPIPPRSFPGTAPRSCCQVRMINLRRRFIPDLPAPGGA